MFKITHSAGHALTTPGKQSPDGFKEWQYTNEIVKLVMEELDQYENVSQKRIDDPTGKTDYPLEVRTNMVNSFNPNLHIDYHMNAFGNGWTSAGGTEVFVYNLTLKEAFAIASKIQTNLVSSLGFYNRGVKAGDLHMVRETNPTAILIEFAFMSNQDEAMKMRTAEYQRKAALAVVSGIAAQYGLKRKAVPVPKSGTIVSQGGPDEILYIHTGGYAGPALQTIHDYLFKTGHGFDAKRGGDGSIVFLIGPFDTSKPNFEECRVSVSKIDGHMQLLTQEQASKWR